MTQDLSSPFHNTGAASTYVCRSINYSRLPLHALADCKQWSWLHDWQCPFHVKRPDNLEIMTQIIWLYWRANYSKWVSNTKMETNLSTCPIGRQKNHLYIYFPHLNKKLTGIMWRYFLRTAQVLNGGKLWHPVLFRTFVWFHYIHTFAKLQFGSNLHNFANFMV